MVSAQKQYRIQIDNQHYSFVDPVITGQQLLDAVGKRPTDQYLIYQLLQTGQLEGLRPDETVDLRQPGVETFLTFESDRAFFFTLDGRKFEWGVPLISGHKLKALAGVDPATYEVWQEVRGADDRPIADQALVSLELKGTERFFTGKKTTTEG